jgi:2-polyprenyl-3-methyl-5-hydroxy-6-metoxy-1,4-benzoquinol methylase
MPGPPFRPRVGILVVAYNAASTIQAVLDRIPPATWEKITEVFIFDDASQDDTCERAAIYRDSPWAGKIRILRNTVNLGYGGNQKRGYTYAIQRDLDIVVLLHGDGQYAPECLEDLIAPIERGEAEAVLGSRMLRAGAARAGGMPLYKFVGNKILTRFQNLALGADLSEYHSGYRAYHVPSLARLPYLHNTNDFHFDNEIILQFREAGLRIKEVPIPTYYGDEICYVNGLSYAWNIVKTTGRYRLHKAGLAVYAEQFDVRGGSRYTYKRNRFSSHNRLLGMVESFAPGSSGEVLDVGCGAGFLAARIASLGYRVVGVDVYDSPEARRSCDEFYVCDVEQSFGVDKGRRFDIIVLADVLEHVRNPEEVLLRARQHLAPGGRILASTGNVAHLYVRLALLLGRFTYTERGLLDRTHVRLFTRATFRRLFEMCSLRVVQERSCPIPFENLLPGRPRVADALCWIDQGFGRIWPSLFAYQTVLEAQADERAPTDLLRQTQLAAPYDEWDERPSPQRGPRPGREPA